LAPADDDIKKALVQFNYDDTILTEGKKILADGDQLAKEYIKVAGEKKEVASSVGKMSKEAGKVFSQHIKLSRLALQNNPQLLEKLGILVLSRGYHHKKKEAKPGQPAAEKKEVGDKV
jgi:hypothetical protein